MKTNNDVRFGLFAFALAATLAGAVAIAGPVQADNSAAPVAQVNHVGPGVGSVKAPPFTYVSASSASNVSSGMQFHVESSLAAKSRVHVGPGIGSVKAPGVR